MKLRRNFLACLGALIFASGCAGHQWREQMVIGSNGPAWEIRPSRSPAPAKPLPTQPAVVQGDSQDKQAQLQQQLLHQAAMLPVKDFKDYKVGSEDVLTVTFLSADQLSMDALVSGQGEVSLLLVGDVKVDGLTTSEIAKKLTELYKQGDYLANPQITVAVKEYRHERVAVTGAVNKPAFYPLIGPRTLLEVLSMAGGLSTKAGETVRIVRTVSDSQDSSATSPQQSSSPQTQTVDVDLTMLLLKGDMALNYPVQNGDVILVPFARAAYVLGAVNRPGGLLLQDNMTVAKAIAQSGGLQLVLASQNAVILRVNETGRRETLPVDLDQITKGFQPDIALKPNDIVYVMEGAGRRFMFDFKTFLPGRLFLSPAML